MPAKQPKLAVLLAGLLAMSCPASAWALNCQAQNTELVQEMYKIYLKSGKAPYLKVDKFVPHKDSLVYDGIATALINYEECWKDSTPCDDPAEYREATIRLITTKPEINGGYGGRGDLALTECFMRIGAAGTYKARNR